RDNDDETDGDNDDNDEDDDDDNDENNEDIRNEKEKKGRSDNVEKESKKIHDPSLVVHQMIEDMTKIPLISDALKEVAHGVPPVDAPPSFNKLNFKLKRDSDGTVHAKNIDDVSCVAEKRSVNVVEVHAHKFVNATKDKTVQVTKKKCLK
nr:hypothetical protein [Tanacetum cinerariifolium]